MIHKELDVLRNKCLLFNQFMIEKGGIPSELLPAFHESNKLINEAHAVGNIKVLKAMSRDIDDQVLRHMPESMAIDLKAVFRVVSIEFDTTGKTRLKAIDKILNKKKLTDSEFEILINRVDEIYDKPTKEAEVAKINELLATFEASKGKNNTI
jgi:hypothetical protein